MIRTFLAAVLLCVVCSSAYACDAMRPCYGNGKPLYGEVSQVYGHSAINRPAHAAHRNWRRGTPPPGLARVATEGAGQIVAHPHGCPRRAFCGCGASVRVFGRSIRRLWLARNWFSFPRSHPAPGMVAVRRHHVFVLERHIKGRLWRVYDANSGHHRTRIHARSIAGWTVVNPHGSRYAAAGWLQ